ncbi:DUF134 domain-containing protein [Clostridium sediminicola]|uniref:DUF134 domain-containing protein n=1 Tax=Clostridium sediminicola TaxID=3114879 RepID=UPI0031F27089
MPRPTKWRRVQFQPGSTYFVPADKRNCEIEEIVLKVEEVEAMRLKDIENLNQEQCAEKMLVSRQTFQNIIDKAREKVARALIEGKAIRIAGGKYTFNVCKMRCIECGEIFDMNYEKNQIKCPKCESDKVTCVKKEGFCHKKCNKHN